MITAIVTLETNQETMPELERLAKATMHIFDTQVGFVGKKLLKSEAGTKLIQIVEWDNAEAATACMMSPDWQTNEANQFMQLIQSGKATMQPENYAIL